MNPATTPPKHRWQQAAAWGALLLASALGFLAYLRPEFVADLAGRMFLCGA